MTILLRLLNPTLQFVPYGKGRIHARWSSQPHTICGRPLPDVKALIERKEPYPREMDTVRLCGNCYSSLRTYGPQVELVSESEVEA